MKRKSPPTPAPRHSKRRRLSPTKTPTDSNRNKDDTQNLISPLTDISDTINKISPRPAQLITKQLQSKRIMLQTHPKQRINLTDDEQNTIQEEDEQYQNDFDDENETEIGRGKQTSNQYDMELNEDPFAIQNDFDALKTKNTNKNQENENEFETIPEQRNEIDIDSENENEHQTNVHRVRISVAKSRKNKKRILHPIISNRNKQNESEMDTDYAQYELPISHTLLSQNVHDIEMEHDNLLNDNQSMDMSLQLNMDKNMNDILLHTTNENDSQISHAFDDINISNIGESVMDQYEHDIIERSKDIEQDEKALELNENEQIIIPNIQQQQNILAHTISQINDNETLIEIRHAQPQITSKKTTKTYSFRKRKKKKASQTATTSKQVEQKANDFLTPITRELHDALNQPMISPMTRSRRKQSGRAKKKRTRIQILPIEVELEPMVEIQEEKKKEREREIQRRKRRENMRVRGRSYSLLDEFRRKQMEQLEDDDDDEILDEKEDEIRQMILNQSGLSQEWDNIEKQRKKKRRQNRKRLATHTKRKKTQKQKTVRDADFGVRRPVMSETIAKQYKQTENELANFWRNIETKMEQNEFENDIQLVQNENELNIFGGRAQTPPRIRKHLEKRYRKQYENMSGDLVDIGKKKGKRVWFLQQKKNVLNDKQNEMFEADMNNSLMTLSEMDNMDNIMDGEYEMDNMSLHSISGMSKVSRLSIPLIIDDELQSRLDDEQMIDVEKEKEKSDHDEQSIASGLILPSICDLSSIMEENEQDISTIDDPFHVNIANNNNQQIMDIDMDNNIDTTSQISQSESQSSITF